MPSPNPTPDVGIAFGTPFAEQVTFLLEKLNLPTAAWDDIQQAAHDKAFIVAGAARADLLQDLHDAVTDYANTGKGLAAFQRDFIAIVAKNGWTGWTGEGTPEGVAWRARTIYQTNMITSYSAGRYQYLTQPAVKAALPYWRYIHSDNVAHPRPQHLAWHGLTLPTDHPFWRTHFAPNGWGCQCRVAGVSRREGLASAKAGLGEPPADWESNDGIDDGFAYTPGAATDKSLRDMVDAKLIKLHPAIGDAMFADVRGALGV